MSIWYNWVLDHSEALERRHGKTVMITSRGVSMRCGEIPSRKVVNNMIRACNFLFVEMTFEAYMKGERCQPKSVSLKERMVRCANH